MVNTPPTGNQDYAAAVAAAVAGEIRLLPPGLAIAAIRLVILEAMEAQAEADAAMLEQFATRFLTSIPPEIVDAHNCRELAKAIRAAATGTVKPKEAE